MNNPNFDYYVNNFNELLNLYDGKFIVIKDEKIAGAYNSNAEAYFDAKKSYEPGTFIIMHCIPGVSSYSQTFHSRVVF
jgi:hypothetical protein